MFEKFRKSKIEIEAKQQHDLVVKKQEIQDTLKEETLIIETKKLKIKDKQNETNSKIETKIKRLENLAYRKKQVADRQITELQNLAIRKKQIADGQIAEINVKIEKGKEEINLEAKYYNKLAKDVNVKKSEPDQKSKTTK